MCNWIKQNNYEYYIDNENELIVIRKPYATNSPKSDFDNEKDMKNIAIELNNLFPNNTYNFRFIVNRAGQDLPYEIELSEI